MSSGTITKSSSTVGSSTTPVYLNSGTITSTGYDLSTFATPDDFPILNISEFECGRSTVTVSANNSNGTANISHNLSTTPSGVWCTPIYGSYNTGYVISIIPNSSYFSLCVTFSSTSTASRSVNIYWLAIIS